MISCDFRKPIRSENDYSAEKRRHIIFLAFRVAQLAKNMYVCISIKFKKKKYVVSRRIKR